MNFNSNYVTNVPEIPFVLKSDKFKNTYPTGLTPIAPDEVFTFMVHSYVSPNVQMYRYLISNYGRLYDNYEQRFVPASMKNGYCRSKIVIYTDPFTTSQLDVYIHRLVCYYFNYFPGCETLFVNHKNGNKLFNKWTNLEWVTPQQNVIHAVRNNLIKSGGDSTSALLTNDDAEKVCQMIVEGLSNEDIGKYFNVSASLISAIRCGETYRNVSDKYNITQYARKQKNESLTTDQVHKICQLLMDGKSSQAVADEIGCELHQVRDVRYGNSYIDISSKYRLEDIPKKKVHNRMDESLIRDICSALEENKISARQIAIKFNVNKNTVNCIKNGTYYTDISKDYNIIKNDPKERPTEETIRAVCRELEKHNNKTANQIAVEFGCTVDTVRHLKRRTIYKNITKDYNY